MAKRTLNYNLNSCVKDTPILKRTTTALLKNNIVTVNDLTDKTRNEIKAINGVSPLGLASVELFLREVGLILKKEEKKEKVKDDLLDLKKSLVFKYLKVDAKPNWGNELRAAQKLLEKHPEIEFWDKIHLPFKLNSLFFFLSQKGKDYLILPEDRPELPTIKRNSIELEENKVGTDLISYKPKSIKDFINER